MASNRSLGGFPDPFQLVPPLLYLLGFNALLGIEMEFYPDPFILGINHTKGMASKSMHMSIEYGMPRSLMVMVTWCNASGREDQKSQYYGASHVRFWVPFDSMV